MIVKIACFRIIYKTQRRKMTRRLLSMIHRSRVVVKTHNLISERYNSRALLTMTSCCSQAMARCHWHKGARLTSLFKWFASWKKNSAISTYIRIRYGRPSKTLLAKKHGNSEAFTRKKTLRKRNRCRKSRSRPPSTYSKTAAASKRHR